jgi:hypothetical protein
MIKASLGAEVRNADSEASLYAIEEIVCLGQLLSGIAKEVLEVRNSSVHQDRECGAVLSP